MREGKEIGALWKPGRGGIGVLSVDLTRQGLWSNAFRALDVGMSGIGSPGWAVGCRVREEERVGGVSRTCEPI